MSGLNGIAWTRLARLGALDEGQVASGARLARPLAMRSLSKQTKNVAVTGTRYATTPSTVATGDPFRGALATAVRRQATMRQRPTLALGQAGQSSNLLRPSIIGHTSSTGVRLTGNDTGTRATSGVPFGDLILTTAQKYDVDPELVAAVVKAESGFNPLAQSRAGAKGLMQLMDGTARSLGVTDSFKPAQNIEGGVKFLSALLKRFKGDTKLALAAYNAGPGAVEKYGGIPPYNETREYVARVMNYWQQSSGIFEA